MREIDSLPSDEAFIQFEYLDSQCIYRKKKKKKQQKKQQL